MNDNHYSKTIDVPKLLAKIDRPIGLEKYSHTPHDIDLSTPFTEDEINEAIKESM